MLLPLRILDGLETRISRTISASALLSYLRGGKFAQFTTNFRIRVLGQNVVSRILDLAVFVQHVETAAI